MNAHVFIFFTSVATPCVNQKDGMLRERNGGLKKATYRLAMEAPNSRVQYLAWKEM